MLQPFETLDPSNKQKNKKQNVEQIKKESQTEEDEVIRPSSN